MQEPVAFVEMDLVEALALAKAGQREAHVGEEHPGRFGEQCQMRLRVHWRHCWRAEVLLEGRFELSAEVWKRMIHDCDALPG